MIYTLFKDTFIKALKAMLPLWLLVIVISFISDMLMKDIAWGEILESEQALAIIIVLTLKFTVIVASLFFVGYLVYKNVFVDLFGDNGYLYFALPAQKSKIISAKAIAVNMCFAITIAVVGTSLCAGRLDTFDYYIRMIFLWLFSGYVGCQSVVLEKVIRCIYRRYAVVSMVITVPMMSLFLILIIAYRDFIVKKIMYFTIVLFVYALIYHIIGRIVINKMLDKKYNIQ